MCTSYYFNISLILAVSFPSPSEAHGIVRGSLSIILSLDQLSVHCVCQRSLPLQLSCLSIDPSLRSMASRITQSDQLGQSANTICMEIHLQRGSVEPGKDCARAKCCINKHLFSLFQTPVTKQKAGKQSWTFKIQGST